MSVQTGYLKELHLDPKLLSMLHLQMMLKTCEGLECCMFGQVFCFWYTHKEMKSPIPNALQAIADRGLELLSTTLIFSVLVSEECHTIRK